MSSLNLDPTFVTAALALVEGQVNKMLCHDPVTQSRLNKLAGKSLRMVVSDRNLSVWVHLGKNEVRLASAGDENVDSSVIATQDVYLKLLQAKDKQAVLANEDVQIQGSSQLLIGLSEAASDLDVDIEGWIAEYVGQLPGQFIGQGLRKVFGSANDARKKFHSDVQSWLHHESNLLPSEVEVTDFRERLRSLRSSLDRLEARTRMLDQDINFTN